MAAPGTRRPRRLRGRRAQLTSVPPVILGEWGVAGGPPEGYDPGAPTGPVELAAPPADATSPGAPPAGTVPERQVEAEIPRRAAQMEYPHEVASPLRTRAYAPAAAGPQPYRTMSSRDGTELPHWADPPTGEVPRALAPDVGEDELEAWRLLGARGLHWREDMADWSNGPGVEDLVDDADEPVTPPPPNKGGPYSFDEEFERLERDRSTPNGRAFPDAPLDQGPTDGPPRGDVPAAGTIAVEASPAPEAPPRGAQRRAFPARHRPPAAGPAAAPPRRATRPYDAAEHSSRAGSGRDVGAAVATGAVLVAVFIACYVIGPAALLALSAAVLLGCTLEAFAMLQRAGFRPATLVAALGSLGVVLAAYWRGSAALTVVAAVVLGASLVWYLARVVEARPVVNVAVTFFGFAWVGLLGSFAGLLLAAHKGEHLFLGAIVPTIAADVAAWFAGSRFGSHQLAPRTSPGKTWEGVIGGAVAALVAGAIIGKEVAPWGGLRYGLLLGALIAIAAPLGDLAQSMLKRDLRLKDSGALLPGHGGLLDRFDSLLFTLPVTYFLAVALHLVR